MPREFGRNRRVADLIQQELAVLLQREFSDPAANLITISTVDVSPDLRHAKVFVTAISEPDQRPQLIRNLNRQAARFRHSLGKSLRLRSVPELKFTYDEVLERANRISDLLDNARSEDK